MARISFVPLPEFGHINPTLKLAKQLARRGHEVSYLSLPDFEEHLCSQGLGFHPIFPRACPKGSLKELAERKISYFDVLFSEGTSAEILEVMGRARADLLLIDIVMRDLALLARRIGAPCALIATALEQFRLEVIEPEGGDPAEDHPVLILCPQALDLPQTAEKKGRHYIEASIDLERRDSGQFPWEKLDASKQLVFCSLGSHPQDYKASAMFFRAVLNAGKERPDWQMVLAAGQAYIDNPLFRNLPPNVLAVDWVPQLAMLQKASVMITHGGLGTLKECIYFGVPVVVFPMRFDQPGNAARVVLHGLGLQGSTTPISCGQILRLVDKVLADPTFRSRMEAMGETFRAVEESGRGVQVVEEILDGLRSGHLQDSGMTRTIA